MRVRCVGVLVSLLVAIAARGVAAEPQRFNIISIVTDDQARWGVSLYGKRHLGTQPQFHPTRHGFDHFYGWLLTPQSIDPVLEVNGQNRRLTGSLPDLMVDEAIRFVREDRRQPFALCIHFLAPHHPYGP